MDKEEKEIKNDIARRLRLSDVPLWNSLSREEQNRVVEKYYSINDLKNVGIHKVLEENRNIRRNLGSILIGLLLGLFGGVVSDIGIKYIPDNGWLHFFIIVAFFALLAMFIRLIEQTSVDHLKEDSVLKYLVTLQEKE